MLLKRSKQTQTAYGYVVLALLGTISLCLAQQYPYAYLGKDRDPYDDLTGGEVEVANEESRVYHPVPQEPPPPPRDPNQVLVPRMGWVRGVSNFKVLKGQSVSAFRGLRYGVVGSGLARFQPAKVPEYKSNAVIDATREPANCPQFPDLKQITEAESRGVAVDDCLTLDIYTPNTRGSYPVMVFVHGEMLFDGSAAEGQPDYFLEHEVVLVSINYRLAPFGFLTTLTDEMPGNVALADIQMALEWIQQFIRPFGGDADSVTLFGQAGGATLIHALSLSGKANGLFHKLILQSGTALNPYFLDEDPIATIRSFARYARCPTTSDRTLQSAISCFERMSTSQLLTVFERHWEDNEPRGLRFTGGFKLVVGDLLGYLPEPPAALVANNVYPVIAGVTKDAGAFILSRFYNQLTQVRSRNITDYINVVLRHTTQPRNYAAWTDIALRLIFPPEDIRNPSLNNIAQGLLELVNLILYRGPVLDSIRYTSQRNSTYLYCFDYRGQFTRFGHLTSPLPFATDASLSDDSVYLFPYPEEVSQLNPVDKTMARAMTTMWVNFAQHGVPNYNVGVWPQVSTPVGPFIRFANSKEVDVLFELDINFGEGLTLPNVYPQYFTTTTTTTTRRPYPQYPNYPNYPDYPQRPQYNTPPPYRAHETVLNGPETSNEQPQHRVYGVHYPNYPERK